MRDKLTKIVQVATLGLALAFTFGCNSSYGNYVRNNFAKSLSANGASYAAEYGCKWNYIFQQDSFISNRQVEEFRANVAAESRSNPNCAEVIWEAVQRENGNSYRSGVAYAAARGCRWAYQLQYGWFTDNRQKEEIRANVAVEALQYNNCAEVIREAKQRENR